LREVVIRRLDVLERIFAEDLLDAFGIGIRIEHQVGFRVGLARGEGQVQQMIEDGAVERGLFLVILEEGVVRIERLGGRRKR
jgi:hypothetical protein